MTSKNRSSDTKKSSGNVTQPPQWTEFLCCSVCEKDFNRTDRCPISLACGHTFCRSCLGKLKQPQCHFDQTPITCNKNDLPTNSALLQLLPGDSEKPTPSLHTRDASNISQYIKNYENARASIEELALYLKPGKSGDLSRPMQRKLVALINCQLFEDEGRKRALRASRALGERTATELILLHQNPTTLSASLWAAVRARGCQFLGPAMQEEALKLIHLALEDGSELSRKVLVQIVVKNLQTQFSQASKTSIGHVVQLLYRASCFKVTKRDGESSLMRLKDEFLVYEELRKEHDTQIVQIAREAGLRIAPDQWSALLYGDQVHKSHMQSIIDRLQSGVSFSQCIADLSLALQRSSDPGNIQSLLLHFKYLCDLDLEQAQWDTLEKSTYSVKVCVKELIEFMKHHHHWMWQCQDATQQTSKYKTSMCRDSKNKGICPRGQSCTFAHSEAELQHYRNRRKKGGQIPFTPNEFRCDPNNSVDSSMVSNKENQEILRVQSGVINAAVPQTHVCQCGNTVNQPYNKGSVYYQEHLHASPSQINQPLSPTNVVPPSAVPLSQERPFAIPQQVSPVVGAPNMPHQPTQVHYVAGSPVMYETKPPGYEPLQVVANAPPTTQTQYPPCPTGIPVAAIEIPSPSKPMQGRVVQPNQYIVHRQPSPTYLQQPNQVHTMVQEPVLTPHPSSYPMPPSYTCLTLQNRQQMAVPAPSIQNGQQIAVPAPAIQNAQQIAVPAPAMQNGQHIAVPTPTMQNGQPIAVPAPSMQNDQQMSVPTPARPEMIRQPPLMIQQPPMQVQNLPSNQHINYQSSVMVQASPQPNIILPPSVILPKQNENIIAPAMVSPVVIPQEDIPVVPKANYDQYHVVIPAAIDSSASLAELRHRKDEVINKLVKKRIVAPKIENNFLQQQVGYMCEAQTDEAFNNGSGDKRTLHKPEYFAVTGTTNTNLYSKNSFTNNVALAPNMPSYSNDKSSDGHYSLWTGTTGIPSLSNFSTWDEHREQNLTGIDVLSGLDTNTAQVSARHEEESYVGKYSHALYNSNISSNASSYRNSYSISPEDEIVSIQDQRIVSKYGPIARTVRSKTTSAIPEQVTANANGMTHPFLSDKNRNKSSFVAIEQNATTQNLMFIRSEVEPTAVSVGSSKLPSLVPNSYTHNSMPSGYPPHESSQSAGAEENEDLMLAIELQQIEMGIQRIQRDSKSK